MLVSREKHAAKVHTAIIPCTVLGVCLHSSLPWLWFCSLPRGFLSWILIGMMLSAGLLFWVGKTHWHCGNASAATSAHIHSHQLRTLHCLSLTPFSTSGPWHVGDAVEVLGSICRPSHDSTQCSFYTVYSDSAGSAQALSSQTQADMQTETASVSHRCIEVHRELHRHRLKLRKVLKTEVCTRHSEHGVHPPPPS